jgi:hypothetical protein
VTSWYDLASPSVAKVFRDLEINLWNPVQSQDINVQYQIDQQVSWQATLAPPVGGSSTKYHWALPERTIGYRIRFLITVSQTAGTGAYESLCDIDNWGLTANLGRLFTVDASCLRDQLARGGTQLDPQGVTAMQRMANIEDIYYLAAGRAVMYIPDPTSISPAIGVAQINVLLQDFTRDTPQGVAPGYRDLESTGERDMEATYHFTASEQP